MKTPVTVSELICNKYTYKGNKEEDFQRYIYTECSMCGGVDHLMRTSVFWEVCDGKRVLESVDIQYPSELFVDPSWGKYRNRFLYAIVSLWKRIVFASAILLGKKIYLGVGTDMSLETAKEYGKKLVEVAEEALKTHP